jgi:hypothetical protein
MPDMRIAHWLIRDAEPGAGMPPVGERFHAAMLAPGRPLAAAVGCLH